jgi:hypothetical protein
MLIELDGERNEGTLLGEVFWFLAKPKRIIAITAHEK